MDTKSRLQMMLISVVAGALCLVFYVAPHTAAAQEGPPPPPNVGPGQAGPPPAPPSGSYDRVPPQGGPEGRPAPRERFRGDEDHKDNENPPRPPDPDAIFSRIDANGDGMISKEEFRDFHQNHRPPHPPMGGRPDDGQPGPPPDKRVDGKASEPAAPPCPPPDRSNAFPQAGPPSAPVPDAIR